MKILYWYHKKFFEFSHKVQRYNLKDARDAQISNVIARWIITLCCVIRSIASFALMIPWGLSLKLTKHFISKEDRKQLDKYAKQLVLEMEDMMNKMTQNR